MQFSISMELVCANGLKGLKELANNRHRGRHVRTTIRRYVLRTLLLAAPLVKKIKPSRKGEG